MKNKGQALVTLLLFVVITVTITGAAVVLTILNSRGASNLEQGVLTYYIAESGIENGLLRLLRDPSYNGEDLPVGDGTAKIVISGIDPKIITSTGVMGDFSKTIQVQAGYTNNILTVQSWEEI